MSTSSDDPPPGPEELRDDQLSRRYYIGGLIGLPWLWIVHAIHYYGKQRNEDAQRILREEQHIAGMYKRRTKRNAGCIVLCCVIRVLSTACVLTIHVRMGVIFLSLIPTFFSFILTFIYSSLFIIPSF